MVHFLGCLVMAALSLLGNAIELPSCDKKFDEPQKHLVCFPKAQIGMCRETHKSTDDTIGDCTKICGENIALTVGTVEAGVDKTFMNMACLGADTLQTGVKVMVRDENLRRRCQVLGTSFGKLQKFTGDFVTKFELVKVAQEKYAQVAKNNTEDMQTEIAKRIDTDVAKALPSEKIAVLKTLIKVALAHYTPSVADQNEVKDAVQDVIVSGEILVENLRKQMANIRTFKQDCLQVMNIPITNQGAQMVDLCASNADHCWQPAALNASDYKANSRDTVKHVGCCCAGIPAVFGSSEAPGAGLSSNCDPYGDRRLEVRQLNESDPFGDRRLEVQQSNESDETMDACLYAKQEVLRSAKTTRIQMRSQGLDTSGIDAMTSEISECDDGRRLEQSQDAVDSDLDDYGSDGLHLDDFGSGILGSFKRFVSETARRLTRSSVLCVAKPERPTAAHWSDADQKELPLTVTYQQTDGVCSELTLPVMEDKCSSFCGSNSIPFLLGTPNFGFSQEEADAVCMSPGDTQMQPGLTKKCLEGASKMKAHNYVAASLVVALAEVKAAKLVVEGHAQKEAEKLNDWIKTEAAYEFLHMNVGEDEGRLLKKFADRTAAIGGGSHLNQMDLEKAIDWVLDKGILLEENLVKMKAETEEFLSECNVLTTGYDTDKNYMLDLCRVRGTKCLDQENAMRAVCCCGYSPLTSYGSSPSLSATIPGESRRLQVLSDENSSSSSSRRLQDSGKLRSVCDMAQEGCDDAWSRANTTLTYLGRQQLMTREKKKAKDSYDLCQDSSRSSNLPANIPPSPSPPMTTKNNSSDSAITPSSRAAVGCLIVALALASA